jgi:hypothetical protein
MEERAPRDVDQCWLLFEREVAHVRLAQLDGHTACLFARDVEHRGGGFEAEDALPRLPRHRDRDPPRTDGELDDRPICLAHQLGVERDVGLGIAYPGVVDVRPGVVFAHAGQPFPAGSESG